MILNVALALIIGCVCGVFATIIIVGLAFSIRLHKEPTEPEHIKSEETDKHE